MIVCGEGGGGGGSHRMSVSVFTRFLGGHVDK